jgi:tripartite-type tricarboxylate transporter receptor subunit TctC
VIHQRIASAFLAPVRLRPAVALAGLALAGLASVAHAQSTYPNRPVRVIVPFTTGGAADVSARVIGEKLGDLLKQPFVIENRAGGGGIAAFETVKNATPDGHVLALHANSAATKPATIAKLPWDLERDFAYIAVTTDATMVLVGNPGRVKETTLAELTNTLRTKPNAYSYGSCGIASTHHFAMEKYRYLTKAQATHVPYKGCAVATPEVLSGQIELAMVTLSNAGSYIRAGKLRAFGVTTPVRSAAAPDVPTFRESGVAELKTYEQESWYGFAAPAGTPQEVIDRLATTIERVMQMPEVRNKLKDVGLEPIYRGPAEMRKMMMSEVESFTRLTKAAGIKAD